MKRFVSPHYRSLVQGEVEACFKGIAADQKMILELRKRGEVAEGRANKVLTAMERWRLPMLYMKMLRGRFLGNKDAAVWSKVCKNFKDQDVMVAVKKALEEPLPPSPRPPSPLPQSHPDPPTVARVSGEGDMPQGDMEKPSVELKRKASASSAPSPSDRPITPKKPAVVRQNSVRSTRPAPPPLKKQESWKDATDLLSFVVSSMKRSMSGLRSLSGSKLLSGSAKVSDDPTLVNEEADTSECETLCETACDHSLSLSRRTLSAKEPEEIRPKAKPLGIETVTVDSLSPSLSPSTNTNTNTPSGLPSLRIHTRRPTHRERAGSEVSEEAASFFGGRPSRTAGGTDETTSTRRKPRAQTISHKTNAKTPTSKSYRSVRSEQRLGTPDAHRRRSRRGGIAGVGNSVSRILAGMGMV
ncbi:hypothetical protein B484DRAFT_483758 [Ochromonadaceae sp. CCMP2298]|nr:hypothetical protein B484DRAFT_483758 [Ochromonadaceae sp. CCMP2298]